jgi:hypothetical protein
MARGRRFNKLHHCIAYIDPCGFNFRLALYSTAVILCLSVALLPFVGTWTSFKFINPIHSRQDSLDGGSARRKASTYTQKKRTDIH